MEKKLKIRNKGNRKTNFIFKNFEDQKEWKNRGKTKEIFKTNIIFFKKIFQHFKIEKWKNRAKKLKNLLILKETKKRKTKQ